MPGMSSTYGSEAPRAHAGTPHRVPARWLVVIESAGTMLARLFTPSREQVAEFDAGTEEVATMVSGLAPAQGASGGEWDRALQGHTAAERDGARVYALDI